VTTKVITEKIETLVIEPGEVGDYRFVDVQARGAAYHEIVAVPFSEVSRLVHGEQDSIKEAYLTGVRADDPHVVLPVNQDIPVKKIENSHVLEDITKILIENERSKSLSSWLKPKDLSHQETRELDSLGYQVYGLSK
jgi:hypothetical protein